MVCIANSAGSITQDAGDFERLAEFYRAFLRTVKVAYASDANCAGKALVLHCARVSATIPLSAYPLGGIGKNGRNKL